MCGDFSPLDLRGGLEILDDAGALSKVLCGRPRRLVRLVPAEQTSGEMRLAIPRARLVARYVPIPLDEPHKVRRVRDIEIDLCSIRTSADDALNEVLVRVLRAAGKVAVRPEARGVFELHTSTLSTLGGNQPRHLSGMPSNKCVQMSLGTAG